MIKKAKKSVAVGLSVALAVTSVNIPVNSASAAAKKAKLNVTKKTLTAGKSTTLTLKTNKKKSKAIKSINVKYVKVTTSKKAVATVKKVSKKSKVTGIKVTAKKAGKSTITVKVTKGTYKGTYKCTVTVKKKASATKKPTQKPTETPTTEPTAEPTVEPTAEPTQAPTVEPTAEPTTAPAVSQTPIVQEVTNVSAIVTNSVKGYKNTVLAGQDATIQVLVTDKQGNPVANDNVVLRFVPDRTNSNEYYQYEEKTNVATTNAKGIATFVVGPKQKKVKNSDANYLGSYKFKVTEATENIIDEGTLDVATISYASKEAYTKHWWEDREADVLNLNGTANYDDIVKGLNSSKAQSTGTGYGTAVQNVSEGSSQYVGSQQVSTTGENHKVAFKSSVYLNIPSKTEEESKSTSYVQKIADKDAKSGSYSTYETKSTSFSYDIKDLSQVKYATLKFNDVNISKYSKMVVKTIDSNGNDVAILHTYAGKTTAFKQNNFGLQIEKNELEGVAKNAVGIKIEITSKGQVNAANDSGFNVADLTYVYNTEKTLKSEKVKLKDSSVKWEAVKPVYSSEEDLSDTEVSNLGLVRNNTGADGTYTKITKTIPVFPYVGNAIIRCYDKNGKVGRYYACEIKNNGSNVNVLATTKWVENTSHVWVEVGDTSKAYIISEDEATASVGTITEKEDGIVEVDSEKTGTTYLVGTIACGDENVKIDADNEKVYTSVMWNPVADKTVIERGNFAAVEGQSVTFTAQLVDKNNNPVSKAGQAITWSNLPSTAGSDATTITKEITTDVNGQAIAKVNATTALALQGISASDDSKKYDVVLLLGNQKVSIADIYWVALGLEFDPTVDSTAAEKASTFDNANGIKTADASPIQAGETWKYAAQVAAKADLGTNEAATLNKNDWNVINTSGFDFKVAAAPNATGTININGTTATVSSNVNGRGGIVNTLDSTLKTAGATMFVAKKDWSATLTLPFVGEGTPNVSEELTIDYNFGNAAGYSASFVTPTSINKLATATGEKVLLKVVDSKGNPYTDTHTDIKVKIDGGAEVTYHVDNKEGLVEIPVSAKAAGKSTIVAAKVGDLKEIETIVNWKDALGFALQNMKFDQDAKTLTLTFNDDVYAGSVDASEFEVSYTVKDGTEKVYDVTVASVSGREVVLQLPKSNNYDWAHGSKFDVKIGNTEPYKNSTTSVAALKSIAYTVVANKTGESVLKDTYTLESGKSGIALTAGFGSSTDAANIATAKPIIVELKKAIVDKDVVAFKKAYAKYDAQSAEVKAIIEDTTDGVNDLADAKTEADGLDAAVTKINAAAATYSLAAMVAPANKVSDLTSKVEAAAFTADGVDTSAGYTASLKDTTLDTASVVKEGQKVTYKIEKTGGKFNPVEVTVTVAK